jgi:hypothetical protein
MRIPNVSPGAVKVKPWELAEPDPAEAERLVVTAVIVVIVVVAVVAAGTLAKDSLTALSDWVGVTKPLFNTVLLCAAGEV